MNIEKSIVSHLIDKAIKAGFRLRVYDGEEWATEITVDHAGLVDACMSTDSDVIHFYKGDQREGCVVMIYGNGAEVISDYSLQLEDFMAEIETWIEETYQ